MTTPSQQNYQLNANEIEQIGRIIAPSIREAFSKDLAAQTGAQTEEFRKMISSHERSMREVMTKHEDTDRENFAKIDKTLEAANRVGCRQAQMGDVIEL
jgi:hypothetical protein